MVAARKMDELLVSWLGSDAVYENVMELIQNYARAAEAGSHATGEDGEMNNNADMILEGDEDSTSTSAYTKTSQSSPRGVTGIIPPFYPNNAKPGKPRRRRRTAPRQYDSWEPLPAKPKTTTDTAAAGAGVKSNAAGAPTTAAGAAAASTLDQQHQLLQGLTAATTAEDIMCVRDQVKQIFGELGQDPPLTSPSSVKSGGENSSTNSPSNTKTDNDGSAAAAADETTLRRKYIVPERFVRITKDVCRFPSFFNMPLYHRILELWNAEQEHQSPMEVVTFDMFEWYWWLEMEPYDESDRFFRLVKQPPNDYIGRDDFLPFIKALLNDHPGLEFLSSHAEFQEKYAVTVITRIFYCVNKCHSGRITSRQIRRRPDLLQAFHQVDEEDDINKVTRYLSYEHFYVLYCRFWELDHDRDYRICREDLLKYGDHSLSHMIVDRIFDAAPRPFEQENPNRDCLTYESFIYFMLSEEDKSNEVSVRYWFTCVDVDGDGKLNNMEMRSFYAVQLHRMQCMGHEIVPFEDMLCQMMDMIKPANADFFVVEDFLQPECCQVSGALFDALFNLNKYLLFEQRDPFVERQKREDEFECDWDRFACIDYNRLAMEEEAREEEAMEIDWVTVDEDEDQNSAGGGGGAAGGEFTRGVTSPVDPSGAVSEAPF